MNIPEELVVGVIPVDYPNAIFTLHDIEQMEMDVRTAADLNFQSSTLQKGVWRVGFPDEDSKLQFLEALIQLQPRFPPFVILPFRDVPAIIHQARIPGINLTDHQILSKISKNNNGIDTSHWRILETVREDDEMLVEFQIDAESFQMIQARNGI
jgi:hypothetical protein